MNDYTMSHYEVAGKSVKYQYVSYDQKSKTIDIKTGMGKNVYDVPLNRCNEFKKGGIESIGHLLAGIKTFAEAH